MTLRILLDQNVPTAVAPFLRWHRSDWVVEHVYDVRLGGASDRAIFEWAQRVKAIIVTYDEDFSDTRMHPVGSHAGVIRLRVWPTTIEATQAALERLLLTVADEKLPGSLIIVDPGAIRIRSAARHG